MGVDQEASRGLHLGDDDAFARFQAGNADLALLVGAVDAVGVADHASVCVSDLKLRVLQGNAGICGANLPHKEKSVRHIVEADRDHALLPVVRQIDRLGGVEDGVAVRRVHFFHDVGPGLQPGPHSHAIFVGHFLPDHGSACAAAARQIAELEGTAAQGFAGDRVILFDYNTIFWSIFEGNGMGFSRFQVDILGVWLLDGVAGGGLQLLDAVPPGVDVLQHDLTAVVGLEYAQVVELPGDRVVAAPPDLELHLGDGAVGDAVHLNHLEGGLEDVGELDGGGVVRLQLHHMNGVVVDVIRSGLHLVDLVGPGTKIFPEDHAVLVRLALIGKASVHLLDLEGDAGDGLVGLAVPLHQPDAGELGVDKIDHHVLVLGGVDPNGLAVVGVQNVGLGHVGFFHLITPTKHIRQGNGAIRPRHHIVLIAQIHAPDVKAGAGDGVACLSVPLLNGQIALVMVHLGYGDGLLTLEVLGLHMDAHGGAVAVEASGGGDLPEFVVPLADVGHGDGAVRASLLGANHLAVPQDDEDGPGQGSVALVHFL